MSSSLSFLSPFISAFQQFLSSILGVFTNLFATIFGSFGNSVSTMFASFGGSTASYGVWGPIMFTVGIGGAIIVAFGVFMIVGPEKDITEAEDDI